MIFFIFFAKAPAMFCVFSVKKITIFYLLYPATMIKYMALKNEK